MIGWLLLVLLYLVSLLIVVFPAKIVSWHARMYRYNYPDERARAQLDQMQVFNPLSTFVIGKMSDYAVRGLEEPEAFPRMILFIRLLGLIPMIGMTLALLYVAVVRWSMSGIGR